MYDGDAGIMTVAVLGETFFFFTTLTVSTNALVSLCDDTAEQRQLLSESKRYGKFIYIDASKIHVDGFLYHSRGCRI